LYAVCIFSLIDFVLYFSAQVIALDISIFSPHYNCKLFNNFIDNLKLKSEPGD